MNPHAPFRDEESARIAASLVAPIPSPTGTPVIPPAAVPYVLALVGILAVAVETVEAGPITVPAVLRATVRALTLLVAGALPGLRR